jgi:hypothetical protein
MTAVAAERERTIDEAAVFVETKIATVPLPHSAQFLRDTLGQPRSPKASGSDG